MRRVMLEGNYIVLGDVAKCLFEQRSLSGKNLEFGLEAKYLPDTLTTLKEWVNGEFSENGFNYDFEGVPVSFRFIKLNYPFFIEPDMRFYGPEQYKIPNPFEDYWKVRGLVR